MSASESYNQNNTSESEVILSDSLNHSKNIAIIGGDLRQIYLALSLAQFEFSITVYGNDCSYYNLPKSIVDDFEQIVMKAPSLSSALASNEFIIGPIPFSKDNIHINSKTNDSDLTIVNFLQFLTKRPFIAAGSFKPNVCSFFEGHSIPYIDFMQSDSIAIHNAIATAEGTITEAIKRSSINLHGSKVLVLGFGRCGAILAHKLHALNATISVAVRRPEAAASVCAYGYQSISYEDIPSLGNSYDFIFNTVPSMILNHDVLTKLNRDVTIIDIASAPGGTDFETAKSLGLNASLCLGLPGIYAPKTSALYIQQELLPIIRNRVLNQPITN